MTLEEIKSKLTGDKKADREYLATIIEQASKDTSNKESVETLKNATLASLELFDEKEKAEFAKAFEKDTNKYIDQVKEIVKLLDEEKSEEVLAKTQPLIELHEKNNTFQETDTEIFVEFSSTVEMYIYKAISNGKKNVNVIPLPHAYLYYAQGVSLVNLNKFEEGRNNLYKALDFSPLNFDIIFAIIDSYKIEGNLEQMYAEALTALPFAHRAYQVAKLYRTVAYYNEANQKFELAAAALLMARQFSRTKEEFDNTVKEIKFVSEKLGKDMTTLSFDETIKILEENNIQLSPTDAILTAYKSVIDALREQKEALMDYGAMLEAKVDLLPTPEERKEYDELVKKMQDQIQAAQNAKA